MAATVKNNRKRNGQYTPSKKPSKHTRLKQRVKSTTTE